MASDPAMMNFCTFLVIVFGLVKNILIENFCGYQTATLSVLSSVLSFNFSLRAGRQKNGVQVYPQGTHQYNLIGRQGGTSQPLKRLQQCYNQGTLTRTSLCSSEYRVSCVKQYYYNLLRRIPKKLQQYSPMQCDYYLALCPCYQNKSYTNTHILMTVFVYC